jgi:hypothetical protein
MIILDFGFSIDFEIFILNFENNFSTMLYLCKGVTAPHLHSWLPLNLQWIPLPLAHAKSFVIAELFLFVT